MWTTSCEHRALPLAQVRAALEQAIARGQCVEALELEQKLGGERAAAGTELERAAARRAQHGSERASETAREDVAELGRGDDTARRPGLGRARAVVAEPRRIESELHVTREIDRTARGGDLGSDHGCEPLAVRELVGPRFGQFGSHAGNFSADRLQSAPWKRTEHRDASPSSRAPPAGSAPAS